MRNTDSEFLQIFDIDGDHGDYDGNGDSVDSGEGGGIAVTKNEWLLYCRFQALIVLVHNKAQNDLKEEAQQNRNR